MEMRITYQASGPTEQLRKIIKNETSERTDRHTEHSL